MEACIYLLRKNDLYKIGRTKNMKNRLYKYDEDFELLLLLKVDNAHVIEHDLIMIFDSKFEKSNIGNEYYIGSDSFAFINEIMMYYMNFNPRMKKYENITNNYIHDAITNAVSLNDYLKLISNLAKSFIKTKDLKNITCRIKISKISACVFEIGDIYLEESLLQYDDIDKNIKHLILRGSYLTKFKDVEVEGITEYNINIKSLKPRKLKKKYYFILSISI